MAWESIIFMTNLMCVSKNVFETTLTNVDFVIHVMHSARAVTAHHKKDRPVWAIVYFCISIYCCNCPCSVFSKVNNKIAAAIVFNFLWL